MTSKKVERMTDKLIFGYEKHNTDAIATTDKKRICIYFTVLDTHKIRPADIRFRTNELLEEVAKHDDWILESVIWDAGLILCVSNTVK